jgi:hypothetical protein
MAAAKEEFQAQAAPIHTGAYEARVLTAQKLGEEDLRRDEATTPAAQLP